MKLAGCTFTYPGRKDPSLFDVSCALSLSSRVGIIGPNGAGKSTLIKLLTVNLISIGTCVARLKLIMLRARLCLKLALCTSTLLFGLGTYHNTLLIILVCAPAHALEGLHIETLLRP